MNRAGSLVRNLYYKLLCLEIVHLPPLARLGVWLCDRYESRRYRTRVEDALVLANPSRTSGPFAASDNFNIDWNAASLPPSRSRVPGSWFSVRRNLLSGMISAHACSKKRTHTDGEDNFMFGGWRVERSVGISDRGNTYGNSGGSFQRFRGFTPIANSMSMDLRLCWSAFTPDERGHWSLHSCWRGIVGRTTMFPRWISLHYRDSMLPPVLNPPRKNWIGVPTNAWND